MCTGTKPSLYLLVEDIPVQALDVQQKEVIADDHVSAMLSFYGQLQEHCFFRSLSCAIVRYAKQANADRGSPPAPACS